MDEARKLLSSDIQYFDDIYRTLADADAVVILTEWNAYRGLDPARVLTTMKGNTFIDLRNIYEPEQMRTAGFNYTCIGRP
jgi:UDPglucose 6-dehydrogenase